MARGNKEKGMSMRLSEREYVLIKEFMMEHDLKVRDLVFKGMEMIEKEQYFKKVEKALKGEL